MRSNASFSLICQSMMTAIILDICVRSKRRDAGDRPDDLPIDREATDMASGTSSKSSGYVEPQKHLHNLMGMQYGHIDERILFSVLPLYTYECLSYLCQL